MTLREFWRFHFFKVLIVIVVLQIGVIAIIQNYNHKPVAVPDEASILEGRQLRISPILNDTDKDEDAELSVDTVFNPMHGTIKTKSNIVYYTPTSGYFGPDSIRYRVTDGSKTSDIAYIRISVLENLPPMAMADSLTLYSGGAQDLYLLDNDTDNEGDSLFITEISEPVHGRLMKQVNRMYYIAGNPAVRTDSFHYKVSDGKSITDEVPVYVNIEPKTYPLYPWLSTDIGNTNIPGSIEKKGNTFVLTGSGSDIWNERDGFRFVYQFIEGDCEMVARIESIDGTHDWAKAGIMIRETLSGDSRHAFICQANKTAATYHSRLNPGESTEGGPLYDSILAPGWVKIVRQGDLFTFSASKNGRVWEELGQIENPMPEKVYIGIVATSHNNDELATVVYSNLRLKAKKAKW
ncbi:MAG: hypothetical protein GVY19_03800 [Bacteroidetes bacterium]|jgi:hypothetical protein|nr:hypothetical protein [Bacteroidota bacterium]